MCTRGIGITILLVGLACASPGHISSLVSFVVCFFSLSLAPQVRWSVVQTAAVQDSASEFLELPEGMLLDCQPYIEHSYSEDGSGSSCGNLITHHYEAINDSFCTTVHDRESIVANEVDLFLIYCRVICLVVCHVCNADFCRAVVDDSYTCIMHVGQG